MKRRAGHGGAGRGMWHPPVLTSGSPPGASWVPGSKKKNMSITIS